MIENGGKLEFAELLICEPQYGFSLVEQQVRSFPALTKQEGENRTGGGERGEISGYGCTYLSLMKKI